MPTSPTPFAASPTASATRARRSPRSSPRAAGASPLRPSLAARATGRRSAAAADGGPLGLVLEWTAARIVLRRERAEHPVQRGALLGVQRCEELVLEPAHDHAQARELVRAGRGDRDHVAAAILRVALAGDQLARLEAVEQRDEAARVERHRVGDRRLRDARALAEDREDAVVVELESGLLG